MRAKPIVATGVGLLVAAAVVGLLATNAVGVPAAATTHPRRVLAAALDPYLVIRGDGPTGFQIGGYRVTAAQDRNPLSPALTLKAAERVLGRPRCQDGGGSLYVTWTIAPGEQIEAQYGPALSTHLARRCGLPSRDLYVASIGTWRGTRWHTNRGLRVGASVSRAKQLYPEAKSGVEGCRNGDVALSVGDIPLPPPWSGEPDPAFDICIDHGVVTSFELTIQAGVNR